MVESALQWLLACQSDEGWWPGIDMETPYWFDTAIVAGSLLWMASRHTRREDECRRAAARAAEWLRSFCSPGLPPIVTPYHASEIPAEIQLLGLALLKDYAEFRTALRRWFNDPRVTACDGVMQHFYCYIMEAVERTNKRWAWWLAGRFARARSLDGSVPAYCDEASGGRVVAAVSWHCYPAVAQWALLWARLGYRDASKHAMAFLESRQTPSGGLTGGDGPYFPHEEITWAVKYYVDACLALAG